MAQQPHIIHHAPDGATWAALGADGVYDPSVIGGLAMLWDDVVRVAHRTHHEPADIAAAGHAAARGLSALMGAALVLPSLSHEAELAWRLCRLAGDWGWRDEAFDQLARRAQALAP